MSIKLLARDLYRLQREVAHLESELAAARDAGRERIEEELRRARAEKARLRRLLDGQIGR